MVQKALVRTTILTLFVSLFFFAGIAHAQNPTQQSCYDQNGNLVQATKDSPLCAASDDTNPIAGPDGVLTKVVELLSFAAGVAAVIMVILGGFKYVTSNGDANAITSAKNTILYALVGLAVFAVSQAIVIFVIRKL